MYLSIVICMYATLFHALLHISGNWLKLCNPLKCGLLIICQVWYLLTNVCPAYEVVLTYKSTVSLMMVMC